MRNLIWPATKPATLMIKPEYLLKEHTLEEFPSFPCPRCDSTIQPIQSAYASEQSAESRIWQQGPDADIDHIVGVFTLRLRCSSASCGEQVFCVGNFHVSDAGYNGGQSRIVEFLKPKFFSPTIPIFPIHPKIDDPNMKSRIADPLRESFSLFWNNPSAAGNSLRIVLEALMDYRGIKNSTINSKRKRERISLHSRIEMFKRKHPHLADIGDKLIAVKWIGNGGSHLAGLKHKHMVTAYKLMEHIIDELFNKTSVKLKKTAKVINKTKKPI